MVVWDLYNDQSKLGINVSDV